MTFTNARRQVFGVGLADEVLLQSGHLHRILRTICGTTPDLLSQAREDLPHVFLCAMTAVAFSQDQVDVISNVLDFNWCPLVNIPGFRHKPRKEFAERLLAIAVGFQLTGKNIQAVMLNTTHYAPRYLPT